MRGDGTKQERFPDYGRAGVIFRRRLDFDLRSRHTLFLSLTPSLRLALATAMRPSLDKAS
jgi:hypothetical protein